MSEEKDKSKKYDQSNSETDDPENKDQRRAHVVESEREHETDLPHNEEHEKEKNLRKSHLYMLQESSPFAKRTCHRPVVATVNVKARNKLIIASVLCVIFIIATVVGGILSNSLAVAADAAHTLTDFAGFMISLFAIWLAGRQATERLTFGWYRAEVIGALASVMTIWCVTAVLVWLAIQRCIHGHFEINSIIMMITAAFGILTNIILGIVLMWGSSKTETSCGADGENHSHHHHHHHHHGRWLEKLWEKITCSKKKVRRPSQTITVECRIDASDHENINIRTAILHVVTDALQSIGVLIAGLIIYFRPDWVIADPICTFLFAVLVLFSTLKIMKDIGLVLMEGTPKFVDYQELQTILENIEGVKSVHNLRIWALNINKIALSVHLVAYEKTEAASILRKAEQAIHKRYHLYETTIQIEEEGEHD